MTVREVCESFWKIEKNYYLTSDKRKSKLWVPFRFTLYYFITNKIGLFDVPHPDKSVKRLVAKNRKGPFNFSSSKTFALFPSARKIGGEDIYSSELLRELGADMDVFDQGQHTLDDSYGVDGVIEFADRLTPYLNKLFGRFILSSEIKIWLKDLAAEFGLNVKEFESLYRRRMMKYYILEKIYLILFSFRKYQEIFLVGAYFRMHIVSAARKKGIRVSELQHGVITPYHLGYSYPEKGDVWHFPDELICMGKFWTDYTPMPANVTYSVIRPSFIKRLSESSMSTPKKSSRVIFNSQGVIGKDVFLYSLKVAKICPELDVVFRLHPSEILLKYEELLESEGGVHNFSLSHKTPNIFSLMAEAEYVVGAFSTTLFEAMVLGCKVILLYMTGIEYMTGVLQRGDAILVDSPEDFKLKYREAKVVTDSSYYYALESTINLKKT